MDVVIPHDTILGSLIDLPLQFAVQVKGLNIPSLNPGGKQLVNSSEILKISRRLESASWSIEVLIDGQLSGLKLEAKHFLDYVLITFHFQRIESGKHVLVAEGVREKKSIDLFLRMGRGIGNLALRNRIWKKRDFEMIAKAPPEYARTLQRMRVLNIWSNVDDIVPDATLDSNKMTSPPRRGIGNVARRNRIWKRRNSEVIAKAPPEYARTMPPMRVVKKMETEVLM